MFIITLFSFFIFTIILLLYIDIKITTTKDKAWLTITAIIVFSLGCMLILTTQQDTVNSIGKGNAHIETIYHIKYNDSTCESDTVKIEYKLIDNNLKPKYVR